MRRVFQRHDPHNALRRSRLHSPALQALLIQLIVFPVLLGVAYGLPIFGAGDMTVVTFALLQGMAAALVSRWRRLAPWWMLIQFLFPLAVLVMLSIHLPPWIFLVGFLLLAAIYWSTYRTQVPFYPSSPTTWQAVAATLPRDEAISLIDIGSGFGGLIRYLARRRPDCRFTGIELAPLPWLASAVLSRLRGPTARFIRGDYDQLDLAAYDVVFAYLSPAAMPALWAKARREMRPGTLLLSCEFRIPGEPPHMTLTGEGGNVPLYGWRL